MTAFYDNIFENIYVATVAKKKKSFVELFACV